MNSINLHINRSEFTLFWFICYNCCWWYVFCLYKCWGLLMFHLLQNCYYVYCNLTVYEYHLKFCFHFWGQHIIDYCKFYMDGSVKWWDCLCVCIRGSGWCYYDELSWRPDFFLLVHIDTRDFWICTLACKFICISLLHPGALHIN